MNDREWYAHRAAMHNYMPTMIAHKRKHQGVVKWIENVLAVLITLVVIAFLMAAVYWPTKHLGWNPVLLVIGTLVVLFFYADWVDRLLYRDDSGLHNLEGYDPVTRTVPDLEAQGFDTKSFTTKLPPAREIRRQAREM